MNYIEQINGFWAVNEELQLKANEIAVYFALLKYNNSLGWIKEFRCDYAIICQYAGVSKTTFYNTMESLVKCKLIEYTPGERNTLKPKVVVLKIGNKKGTIKEQQENNTGIEEEQKLPKEGIEKEQERNLYKLLNNKTIKLIYDNAELVNEKIESWIEEEKKEDWNFDHEECETFEYDLVPEITPTLEVKKNKQNQITPDFDFESSPDVSPSERLINDERNFIQMIERNFPDIDTNLEIEKWSSWYMSKHKTDYWKSTSMALYSSVIQWLGKSREFKKEEQEKQKPKGKTSKAIEALRIASKAIEDEINLKNGTIN